jgi:hypothetical protein
MDRTYLRPGQLEGAKCKLGEESGKHEVHKFSMRIYRDEFRKITSYPKIKHKEMFLVL